MLHILFSSSAAGTLRQAIGSKRLRQRVIDLTDDLDWGPIAIDQLADREAWLNRNIPCHGPWDWLGGCETRFRQAVEADEERLIWIAPRSATEQAGLYWYLDQFGALGAQMVIAEYPLRGAWEGQPPSGLGELGERQMTELLEECPRSQWHASRFPADRWQDLVNENALLRVVIDGQLESAPENFFDHFLVEHCAHGWTKWARTVGDAMIGSWEAGHRPSSFLLTWRLRQLILSGAIACDGELPQPDAGSACQTRVRSV